MEHPQTLRPQNLKSVAMATVVARYPQNLISSRPSWGTHTLKIFIMGLGCETPTSFMPADSAGDNYNPSLG